MGKAEEFAALIRSGVRLPKRVPGECRMCRVSAAGRAAFCSEECKDEFYLATSNKYLRLRVYERDRGVCSDCGEDCDALEVRVWGQSTMMRRPTPQSASQRPAGLVRAMLEGLKKFGYVGFRPSNPRTFWEADHDVALDEGGSCGLSNVVTRCVPCHTSKTAEAARRKGKKRRLIGKKHLATEKQLRRSRRTDG